MRELLAKHKELIRYVFVGGLTTVVSFGSLFAADYFFTRFSPEFLGAVTAPAAIVSWICAVTFAFFANKIFVFRSRTEKKSDGAKQAVMFYTARLATLGFEVAFLFVTVDLLGFNIMLMKVIEQVFILVGNYLLSKFVIFKKKEK
jgi:putative flippase GtrA